MKMLVSYLYCNLGGVTSVIKQRLPTLIKNGWEVDTAFKEDNGGKNDLLASGVGKVYILNNQFNRGIRQLLYKQKYDVHVIIDSPSLLPKTYQSQKTKTIFEIHTSIEPIIRRYPIKYLSNVEAIITPSQWLKTVALNIFPSLDTDTFYVIPNLISKDIYSPVGRSIDLPPTILWVGKFTPLKNWQEALRITGAFLQVNTDWSFTMVTGGNAKKEDVNYALSYFTHLGLINRFRWLRNLNQESMGRLYRGVAKSGGFLLSTSKAESFCLVVYESMSCGLPVVSSKIGPIPEIIPTEENGLLYELGNIDMAIKKCNELLDEKLRMDIIRNGLTLIDIFTKKYNAESYLYLLNSILGED